MRIYNVELTEPLGACPFETRKIGSLYVIQDTPEGPPKKQAALLVFYFLVHGYFHGNIAVYYYDRQESPNLYLCRDGGKNR